MTSFVKYYVISTACIVLLMLAKNSNAQVTAIPMCESTGHRCINLDECAGKANDQYQWCGGCQYNVRCQNGVGALYTFYNPSFTLWDDNRKNYELTSTTCTECYYPCPPGPSAPQQPTCQRTGLGCLSTVCIGGPAGSFQYCGNCSHYIYCPAGNTQPINLIACTGGQVFDDISRSCQATSQTCRECYDTCYPPTTTQPTTQTPTTEAPEETTLAQQTTLADAEEETGTAGTHDDAADATATTSADEIGTTAAEGESSSSDSANSSVILFVVLAVVTFSFSFC